MKNYRMKAILPAIIVMILALTLALTGCGEPSTLEGYVKNDEELAKELELYNFPGMSTDVSGNTLMFTYEYDETFDEDTAKLMSNELKDALKTNSENFEIIKERFVEVTGIDEIKVTIKYVDAAGTELCAGEY